MKEKDTVLVREPDLERRAEIQQALGNFFHFHFVETVDEAQEFLSREVIHAIVVRERIGVADGVMFCRTVHQCHSEVKIVLVVADTGCEPLIDAFNENHLFRCLIEPVERDVLTRAIRGAVRRFEMDRVQNLLIVRATEIDRQIHSGSYWFYRVRTSFASGVSLVAGSFGIFVVGSLILVLAGVGGFLLLYYLKTALGFDFFANKHLGDFL